MRVDGEFILFEDLEKRAFLPERLEVTESASAYLAVHALTRAYQQDYNRLMPLPNGSVNSHRYQKPNILRTNIYALKKTLRDLGDLALAQCGDDIERAMSIFTMLDEFPNDFDLK